MKRIAWMGVGMAVAALGLAGCDWETGGDATNWSSAYNWVNFSGTYRSSAGGLLVTDYTTTPVTPGSTNTLTVANEAQGTFAVNQTFFEGKLKHGNIVPGSVDITLYSNAGVEIQSYSDDGNGVLGPGSAGNVAYVNGSWNINRGLLNPVTQAGYIRATYSYYVYNEGSAGGGAQPGSTGKIFVFNISHQGQNLTITDNNGATYTGYIREMRTTSGTERADEEERVMPRDGDTVVATFQCAGHSAAQMSVKIVGSLQGTVAASVFSGRTITGTWIELGGKTGDINGQTTAVAITVPETATETPTETPTE